MEIETVGSLAHVNFRVRCETLGHGEIVKLVRADDNEMAQVRETLLIARTLFYPNPPTHPCVVSVVVRLCYRRLFHWSRQLLHIHGIIRRVQCRLRCPTTWP